MDEARLQRVRTVIKAEVSEILRSFKDPRLGFVSVTDVELSRDARVAKVYVSVLGNEEVRESSMKALKSGTGFVRSELGQRLPLRHVPEVIFRLDNSIERGTRIQSLLGKLYPEESGGPPDRDSKSGGPDGKGSVPGSRGEE